MLMWKIAGMLLALVPLAGAEIVDRIAVSVGAQVITEDQILEEIRVTEFLNQEPLKLDADQKRKAAERLVEQTLMRRDMDFSHYPLPALQDAAEMEHEVQSRYKKRSEFENELRNYRLTEDELRQHLWWQLTMLRFVEFRFRPGVEVSDSDIAKYYAQKRTEWEQQGQAKIPTLEESRADIEKVLTGERVDQAVDRWLGDARTRLEIVYRPEAFQ